MVAPLRRKSPAPLRRKLTLGLGPCAERRPRAPDDATLRAVWQAWQAHGLDRLPEGPQPEHYLALHQATGLSLRTIWPLAREWVDAGLRTRAGN